MKLHDAVQLKNRNLSAVTLKGFTLIEMSIVLVIIGLIVGGVLAGHELISAATIRAQIAQIDKYQHAVNTFRGKYGYLPGDLPDPDATQFGFTTARGAGVAGQGDGNGIIESPHGCFAYTAVGYTISFGEQMVLWRDLSDVSLIDGRFKTASMTTVSSYLATATPLLFPEARMGNGAYISIVSGAAGSCSLPASHVAKNYFVISDVLSINGTGITAGASMNVAQAYNMDKKIDDGLPQSGRLLPIYSDFSANGVNWSAGGGYSQTGTSGTTATPASDTTCYDNAGANGKTQQYSITYNNGGNNNCTMAFQFN